MNYGLFWTTKSWGKKQRQRAFIAKKPINFRHCWVYVKIIIVQLSEGETERDRQPQQQQQLWQHGEWKEGVVSLWIRDVLCSDCSRCSKARKQSCGKLSHRCNLPWIQSNQVLLFVRLAPCVVRPHEQLPCSVMVTNTRQAAGNIEFWWENVCMHTKLPHLTAYSIKYAYWKQKAVQLLYHTGYTQGVRPLLDSGGNWS